MFASASATDRATRDLFVDSIIRFLEAGRVDAAFPECVILSYSFCLPTFPSLSPLSPSLYETTSGSFPGTTADFGIYFIARPVVGGHFSILALDVANKANGVKRDPFGGKAPGKGMVRWGRESEV